MRQRVGKLKSPRNSEGLGSSTRLKERVMEEYYIKLHLEHLLLAALVLMVIIVVAILYGYAQGLRAAERKFGDRYFEDK